MKYLLVTVCIFVFVNSVEAHQFDVFIPYERAFGTIKVGRYEAKNAKQAIKKARKDLDTIKRDDKRNFGPLYNKMFAEKANSEIEEWRLRNFPSWNDKRTYDEWYNDNWPIIQ